MLLKIIVMLTMCLIAVITDCKYMKIFNLQILIFSAVDILFAVLNPDSTLSCISGAMLPLILLPLFFIGKIGGGDIKLLSAVGGLMGLRFCAYAAAFSFITGALYAAAILILKNKNRAYRDVKIRFAPMIAAGCVIAVLFIL